MIICTVRVALPDLPTLVTRTTGSLKSTKPESCANCSGENPSATSHLIERFENRIVRGAVDAIGAAAQLEKAIDDLFVESREREQHIARRPGEIDRPAAVESEIRIPIAARGEILPAFHLFQFLDPLEKRVLRLVTGLGFGAIEPREIVRIDVIEQAIDHVLALVQLDAFVFQKFAQNLEPLRIFAGNDPGQIRAARPRPTIRAPCRSDSCLTNPGAPRRTGLHGRIERHLRAGAGRRFRFHIRLALPVSVMRESISSAQPMIIALSKKSAQSESSNAAPARWSEGGRLMSQSGERRSGITASHGTDCPPRCNVMRTRCGSVP